jgi:hypothetical protein
MFIPLLKWKYQKYHEISILVGGYLPLWKIWKSNGIIVPNIYIYVWKNNPNVPNHQPAMTIRSGYLKTCCFLDALQEVHSDFSQSVSFPAELTTLQAVFTVAYFWLTISVYQILSFRFSEENDIHVCSEYD